MLNNKVVNYFDLSSTKGDVGIEIEMETKAVALFPDSVEKDWRIESDNSLKGYGYELVLKTPIAKHKVPDLIKELRQNLAVAGITINPSIRAGVHIHLNMQKRTLRQVYRLMACYFPLETVLTRFCGNGREGNLFCLRARDAEYMLTAIEKSLVDKDIYTLRTNKLRYSALNLQSLFNFGSVEFRGLATQPDLDNISPWVDIISALEKYSNSLDSVWDNAAAISGNGPREWMKSVFGEDLAQLLDYPELEEDIIEDMRRCQMLCYTMEQEGV